MEYLRTSGGIFHDMLSHDFDMMHFLSSRCLLCSLAAFVAAGRARAERQARIEVPQLGGDDHHLPAHYHDQTDRLTVGLVPSHRGRQEGAQELQGERPSHLSVARRPGAHAVCDGQAAPLEPLRAQEPRVSVRAAARSALGL